MSQIHPFQAEVRQLLDIVVHALYSDREVFIRELVSNASDALEKLRLRQLSNLPVFQADSPLAITITTNPDAKTLTITDSGIGMSADEIRQNLGTIAHSGTKKFLEQLKASNNSAEVIGQFGVGFYSAFMVASRVEVLSRSAEPDSQGWLWASDGQSGYELSEASDLPRGTSITLHLKEEYSEFTNPERVRGILRQYSNFVSFPILLGDERVNTVSAIWLKAKSEVSNEEYENFYKFIAHTDSSPHSWFHFASEVPLALHALLFIPDENPERFGFNRAEHDVALYCRKVLIDAHPQGLLPEWLRFLKGVIDSEDLPLNISREMLQDHTLVRRIGEIITKRFIRHLEKLAKDSPDSFERFYANFNRYIKEGIITDYQNKDSLAKLLRFESSFSEPGKQVSLADYVSRMKESQSDIYFLSADSRALADNSPYLDAFKARGLEVLFLLDNGDEFVAEAVARFDDKAIVSVTRSGIELPEHAQDGTPLSSADAETLTSWLGELLGDSFSKTTLSDRPGSRPAIALADPDAPSAQTREFFRAMGQDIPDSKPSLELNPRNPFVKEIASLHTTNPELASAIARQMADTALVSAGLLDDPSRLANDFNSLLAQIFKK